MKKRAFLFLLAMAVMALLVVPLYAQDSTLSDADLELVNYVSAAFENIYGLETYTLQAEQLTSQNMEMKQGGQTINTVQDINQTMSGQVIQADNAVIASTMMVDQTMDMKQPTAMSIVMTMEMIVVDDILYTRFSNLTPMLAAMFPKGWVDLEKEAAGNQVLQSLNPAGLKQIAGSTFLYPINADTVTGIKELEATTIDDMDVRVFEVVLNAQAVFEAGGSALAAMFNSQALGGADPEAMMKEMFQGMGITLTVYISTEDQLVRQVDGIVKVDVELNMMGVPVKMNQTTEATTMLTDFNEPVEITAPELGSEE